MDLLPSNRLTIFNVKINTNFDSVCTFVFLVRKYGYIWAFVFVDFYKPFI